MIQTNCSIYVSGEDDLDDVPLATRLKKQRVGKTGEKSRSSEEIKQRADIHMKRNKVYVFLNGLVFFAICLVL